MYKAPKTSNGRKFNNKNRNKNKTNPSSQISRLDTRTNKNFNTIKNTVNRAKKQHGKVNPKALPMYKFLSGCIDFDNQSNTLLWPLSRGKQHIKTIRYVEEVQVNASGNLLIALYPKYLASFATGSTVSPFWYINNDYYNPAKNDYSLTAGIGSPDGTEFLTPIVQADLDATKFGQCFVSGSHIQASLTGMSTLNRQGQVHFMETMVDTSVLLRSTGQDAGGVHLASLTCNKHNIKNGYNHEVYKHFDISNGQAPGAVSMNYYPLTNPLPSIASTGVRPAIFTEAALANDAKQKVQFIIVAGADVNTKLRLNFEISIQCEVEENYVNAYKVEYSKIYEFPEPFLAHMNQQHETRIKFNKSANTNFASTSVVLVNKQRNPDMSFSFADSINHIGHVSAATYDEDSYHHVNRTIG